MRILDSKHDYKNDRQRVTEGFYALNGYDLTLREVANIMHDNGLKTLNEFVKDRDVYVKLYIMQKGV